MPGYAEGSPSIWCCRDHPLAVRAQNLIDDFNFTLHPIRLVVPFPPGGAADAIGRPWADKMKTTPAEARWITAMNLVQMWPPGRPGRERFADVFCEGIAAFPGAFVMLPILLQAMVQEWGYAPAAALLERLDMRRLEANLSDAQRNAFEENMKPFARLL